ncbi:MAG: glycoside hydrolase family 97 catalytic domain-containing protein, partial [Actinomycetia bacterium]|nr:glycoside hydrolase family 97 catalytic domain-containing protein [Actinomycetes bacterium]
MTLKAVRGRPGVFSSELIALPDGTKAKLHGEFSTPWRTLTIGDRPGDLAESHLIENLNDPCEICAQDTSWIKPATYVGVWWELQRRHTTWTAGPNHGATTERVKEYIDLAEKAGSKFVLAEGWNTNAGGDWSGQDFTTPRDDFDLEEVLAYARQRGIGFIAHNETRGYVDYYDENLERIFSRYEELGIHAIKTGYATKFHLGGVNRSHYDQEAVRHYQRVIDAAARHEITIDAHEAIKPTGLARTYPNMMTSEGVAGMEQQNYKGANGNPPAQASILPFTRFMGGPADYTPGVLNVTWDPADLGTRVQTTSTAQLALYSIFFSPMQMLADTPENYADHVGFSYLKGIPATWDETQVVRSEIGDYVTTARRSGEKWYLGSITDENDRTLRTPLRFLDRGRYVAEIYADAEETTWKGNPLPIEVTKVLVRPSTVLAASMVGGGGYAVRITPATREDVRDLPAYRAPSARLGRPDAALGSGADGDSQVLTVDVPVTNKGSTAAGFVARLSIDGRRVKDEKRVRVAGRGTRDLTFRVDAAQIPDDDFRVRVAIEGTHGRTVRVEQEKSFARLLHGLRRSGEVNGIAARDMRATLRIAERTLRRGDVNGRLVRLQDLRLELYGFDRREVSIDARNALDEVLALRLGSPEGIVDLAQYVRELNDDAKTTRSLAGTLIQQASRAAQSAADSDSEAMRTHLDEMLETVESAPGADLDREAAAALQERIQHLKSPKVVTEAETTDRFGAACLRTDHVDYTGTGFVACLKVPGDGIRLVDAVPSGGSYDVVLRYANAMGSTRTMTVTAGATSTTIDLANLANWDSWSEKAFEVTLAAGDDLSIFVGPHDSGHVNLDSISLEPRLGVVIDHPDAKLS